MPTPEQITAIYNPKRAFEVALKQVYEAISIKAFTSQFTQSTNEAGDAAAIAAGYEILDFQKDRPRVEICFTRGAGYGRYISINFGDFTTGVETAWQGEYEVRCITDANIVVHNAFVTQAWFVLSTLVPRINNIAPLTTHALASFPKDSGSSERVDYTEGDYMTVLRFALDFSVQQDAWGFQPNQQPPPPRPPAPPAVPGNARTLYSGSVDPNGTQYGFIGDGYNQITNNILIRYWVKVDGDGFNTGWT